MENSRWVKIPLEEAKRHPLYGVWGWLLFFAILNIIGLSFSIKFVLSEAAGHIVVSYFVLILVQVAMLLLLFLKIKIFKIFTVSFYSLLSILWLLAIMVFLYDSLPGKDRFLILGFFGSALLVTSAWIPYLLLSKRVRVTFENAIDSNDTLPQDEEMVAGNDWSGWGAFAVSMLAAVLLTFALYILAEKGKLARIEFDRSIANLSESQPAKISSQSAPQNNIVTSGRLEAGQQAPRTYYDLTQEPAFQEGTSWATKKAAFDDWFNNDAQQFLRFTPEKKRPEVLAEMRQQFTKDFPEPKREAGLVSNTEDATAQYRKEAEQGNANAQLFLGWAYANGQGVAKDDVEAVKWYKKAAEQGNAAAQSRLGVMYAQGRGVAKNNVEAAKWYLKAAEQGNANAQLFLGWAYANGQGVAKDDVEAVKWYRKAAEQGNANAQFDLAAMYFGGRGVAKNETEAARWFRMAAEQGDAEAQFRLGAIYAVGLGVAKNNVEAAKWYLKAAEQGNEDAQDELKRLGY
jgi:TPR repeat protein